MRRAGHVFALLFVLLPARVQGERLPIRAYTTAEGLAHNAVNKIVRDSRGFLWFATNDGLSRFDGYGFTNYSVEQGLPHRTVTDLLETKAGELWVATFGGLVRFRPDGVPEGRIASADDAGTTTPMFSVVLPAEPDPRARALISLLEASDGSIWCGTRNGLYRLERAVGRTELRHVPLPFPDSQAETRYVNDLVEDRYGTLWAATTSGLYRRWPDEKVARYTNADGLPAGHLHGLLVDRQGRLWVASRTSSFFRITADGSARPPAVVDHHPYPGRFLSPWTEQLLESADGRFWVSTNLGLAEFGTAPVTGTSRFLAYTRSNGLSHQEVTTLAEDAGGNLWIGTRTSGAMKLARNGFTTYAQPDGLAAAYEVFEDATGELHVHASVFQRHQTAIGGNRDAAAREYFIQQFGRLDQGRFEWFMPAAPFWWGWVPERSTIQARNGEWWLAGSTGLVRYPARRRLSEIRRAKPIRIFTEKDGLSAPQVYRLFADSRDDVWFSIISTANGLFRWDRATATLHDMAAVPGFPPVRDERPRAFGEDASGNIWIGVNSGVVRYRNRKFTFFTAREGVPPDWIVDIHSDAAGRLWLASSSGGLIRVDDPAADRPRFAAYTTSTGLSGNSIEAITSDLHGRVYVATGRGIDQLDPKTGSVRHFTLVDGLAPGTVLKAFRDRTGMLWFATQNGLSRFSPAPRASSAPPAIMITGLTAGGREVPASAVGETTVRLSDLRPGSNQLQIDFVSLRFAPGERLRYQYMLEGADQDWTPPAAGRSVRYEGISPGDYRFLVRAVNADGEVSVTPAVVAFTVLPPYWQRWWFVSLTGLAVFAAGLSLHRYRVSRVVELERVRARIATDLHDDIGASLTRIAILSEVARQQPHHGQGVLDGPLSSIATIARESVTSMSDIVWAISPERDTLHEVVRRMRDHAEDVFEARDVALVLDLPEPGQPKKLGVEVRRDLYLIFKEAVNNAARHSSCSRVSIVFRMTGSHLLLEISDDGVGFATAGEQDGHGLRSMQRRAKRLGASLDVRTATAAGTTIRLTMPVDLATSSIALPG